VSFASVFCIAWLAISGPSTRPVAALSHDRRVWAMSLFIVAFLLELAGVVLVAREIRGDVLAAKRLAEPDPDPPQAISVPEGTPWPGSPGVTVSGEVFGGLVGGIVAQSIKNVDMFGQFTIERLAGNLRWRVVGVALIVLGAIVGLIANLVAVM
jgi:hypothetical protein